jgi:glycosyltransferase involved in cell wall biosynthesis
MTIALDARFLLNASVHPHSRLAHIFLRRNHDAEYPARIILLSDRPPDEARYDRDYAAPNVALEVLRPAGGRLARLRWLFASVPRALRRHGASVFYSSFYFLPPRCAGIRLVNSIHDCCVFYIDPRLNRGLLSSPLYLWVLKRTMRWTNRRANATVTVSRFSKRMLEEHLGLPADRVRVCYHGLDAREEGRRSARERLRGKGDQRPYFLFVGSNLPKKNISQCLAGFARLPEGVRNRHVLRLKTSCYPENRKQIDALGIGAHVEFISGHLDEAVMADLYAGASLLLLLSYDEGFGLPIIEAFAAGVPVLVSDRAACGEIVDMPECKADPDDTAEISAKWLALVEDEGLRGRCLADQDRLLAQFEMKRAADRFYASLIS